MGRATEKRLRRRHDEAGKLTPRAAEQLRARLIEGWSMSYFRRYRASEQDAEVFRAQKQLELRQLGGTESDTRAFDAACATQRFAVADRVSAKAPKVPSHLVSNYEAVEVFSLREGRGR